MQFALLGVMCMPIAAVGCRQTPPAAPKTVANLSDPMVNAREAMKRRDHAAAVLLLRETLARRPAELEAHYRLGVSASHLDRVDEATRAFEWVVAHGEPGVPEVRVARDWLASRAAASASAPNAGAPVDASTPSEVPPTENPELASLSGKAAGPDKPMARLQLFLKGRPGTAVAKEYHLLRTDGQGVFHFPDVVPGEYMLTNRIAGRPLWRLKVTLTKGERRILDLSPTNDTTVRDDFPESLS